MEQARLIGFGCIGRSHRVARMLGKIMRDTRSSYVIPTEAESEKERLSESGTTAGFCIGYDGLGLNLSLYAREWNGHPGKINRSNVYRLKYDEKGLH